MKNSILSKVLLLILTCTLIFVLCSCGEKNQTSSTDSTTSDQTTASVDSTENSVNSSNGASVSSVVPGSSKPREIKSLNIDISKAKLTYIVGEDFDKSTITAVVEFVDGGKTIYNSTRLNVDTSNYDKTKVGEYKITCSYESLDSKEITVRVYEKPEVISNVVTFDVATTNPVGGELTNGVMKVNSFKTAVEIMEASKYAPTVIKQFNLAEGEYKGKISITSPNVRVIGKNRDTTIISYDDCSGRAGGTDNSSSVFIKKTSNFTAKNVTFKNTYDYLNDTEYSDKQAVAMTIDADMCVFDNCAFWGYQDTLQSKNGRHYFRNCFIAGCVDYIFGNNATAVFDNCEIKTLKRNSNEYIVTAHKGESKGNDTPKFGYVFLGCKLTAEEGVTKGSTSLSRPWRQSATVAYIKCEMDAHISKEAYGNEAGLKSRYAAMSNNNVLSVPEDAHFYEFGNTGLGAVDTQLNNDFTMLTSDEDYTLANIFAKINGQAVYADEFDVNAILAEIEAL